MFFHSDPRAVIFKLCPYVSTWHHVFKPHAGFFTVLGVIYWHKLILLPHSFPALLSISQIIWYCNSTLQGYSGAGTSMITDAKNTKDRSCTMNPQPSVLPIHTTTRYFRERAFLLDVVLAGSVSIPTDNRGRHHLSVFHLHNSHKHPNTEIFPQK